MSYQPFTIQDINNGALAAKKAMPQKDSTTDGTSTFEMARKTYVKTYTDPTMAVQGTQVYNNMSIPQINVNVLTPSITSKKWMGNRDASQVVANRRNNAVGTGTLNPTTSLYGFTTYKDINTSQDALRRVRAGGAVAPAKKAANLNNAPTPGFSPAQGTKSVYGLKQPVLFH